MTDFAPLFSTGKDDWETPDDLFAEWDARYHFVLDAAADSRNHKCPAWLGPGGIVDDALTVEWGPWLKEGNIWLNPPYSRGLQARFVEKAVAEMEKWNAEAYERFQHGTPVVRNIVCLLPARTDTRLFHDIILPEGDITFLRGRVRFKGASAGAPFPSMVVVF